MEPPLSSDEAKRQFDALQAFAVTNGHPTFREHATRAARRAVATWPDSPSGWLRFAALRWGIDDELDALFAETREALNTWSPPDEPPRERPSRKPCLIVGSLVLLEQMDYETLLATPGEDTPLRDAITNEDDRMTLAAAVRFTLSARGDSPDDVLRSWRHWGTDFDDSWSPLEFPNARWIRDDLQEYSSLLTIPGQAAWAPYIEPIDAEFRRRTDRHSPAAELVAGSAQGVHPGGWWWYRVRPGVAEDAEQLDRSLRINRLLRPEREWSSQLRWVYELNEFVDRPNGVIALTDHELFRLLPGYRRQAKHETKRERGRMPWQARFTSVRDELVRRGHDVPPLEPKP